MDHHSIRDLLVEAGFACPDLDALSEAEAAAVVSATVRGFQLTVGLQPDGIVEGRTLELLMATVERARLRAAPREDV